MAVFRGIRYQVDGDGESGIVQMPRNRQAVRTLSPKALCLLIQYDWPGNIRELRNVIERAVALSPGPEIQETDLPEALRVGERNGISLRA